MKPSKYNYIVREGDNLYYFNGITKLFFCIPTEKEAFLDKILESPEQYKEKIPNFYKNLLLGGFIVADEIDEIEIIREQFQKACNSKHASLTILPTLNCNFHCWYCYEKHNKYIMTEETIESIKKYIFNTLESVDIESYEIEWFGGEPFLHFENIIRPINLFAKNICDKKKIPFISGATSNGYLVDDKIAKDLYSLNIKHIQVTLDGEKSFHDKTRVAVQESSFERILKNTNYLCEVNNEISITLRINYDDKNFYPALIMQQVKELIDEKNHSRFTFLIRKVWQIEKVNNGKEKIQEFIQLIKESKFNYFYSSNFTMNFIPCYAARKNMKVITPHGSIGKCTTKNDFEKQSLGHLTPEGVIKWNDDLPFDDIYATPLFENKICLNCKQLPLCMGDCPKNIDNEGKIEKINGCPKGQLNDLTFMDAIANYCKAYEALKI